MRAVVTGASGFLGSHITKWLTERGDDVTAVGTFSSSSRQNFIGLDINPKMMVGDLRDISFARNSLRNVNKVYHFAADIGNVAYTHGSESMEQSILRNNIAIDTNVIRACIENKVGTIIYASSVSVYPRSEQMGRKVEFKEEDSERLVEPEGGYGWAKYVAERQLAVLADVKVGIARIFPLVSTYWSSLNRPSRKSST